MGGGQAADRQWRDRRLAQVCAQHVLVLPAAREGWLGEEVTQEPVVRVEVESVDLVVDDADRVRVRQGLRQSDRQVDSRQPPALGPVGPPGDCGLGMLVTSVNPRSSITRGLS
ncbi:hypothetical protein [Kitasatospora paracochleata]|uniref:Uncharacterized protein n=1 Tax=Kitasatospora paracochleata TaxID=58354 RepID=A0ABT1J760_9ACTN|nr:hypothetical protein [Kitasatospora paracochleata]MCP2313275.1 hypothetical protein [Kitasatospora paracochleata]